MSFDWFCRRDDEEEPPLPGRPGVSRLRRQRTAPVVADIPAAPGPAAFVPLGPTTALFGATARRAAVSGRVRAIAVSDDGRRAYAGTSGGLWYTGDAGASWAPLDANATTRAIDNSLHAARALAVGALTVRFGVDATGAADNVVAGTGDPSLESVLGPDGGRGIGIRTSVGPAAAAPAWTLEATNLAGAIVLALAHEDATLVWAATTEGLYRRPAAVADRNAWEQVLPGLFWDVVITPADGPEPRRIWAASEGKLQWSANGVDFNQVALPDNFPVGEARRPVIGRIRLAAGRRAAPVWALASGARLWRVTAAGASPVDGVPDDLSGPRGNDRADLALAVACVPTEPEEIVVAGGTTRTSTPEPAASVYRARVRQRGGRWTFLGGSDLETRVPPALAGIGVPAGVHAIAALPPAPPARQTAQHVWLATEGGVFRSRDGGGGFVPCNAGLPAFEVEQLADHARAEGLLVAGANAAGALRAEALEGWTTVLRTGGGGVAVDPADARRIAVQQHGAIWHLSSDGRAFAPVTWFEAPGGAAPELALAYDAANREENLHSARASSPAAIVAPDGATQLAIGTRRVWFSTEWGRPWHTLPSVGENPSAVDAAGRGPRTGLDLTDGEVLVLRWGTADQLYALTTNAVYLYRRGGAPPAWTRTTLYDGPALKPRKRKSLGDQIPPDMPRTSMAVHLPDRAPHGSLYVTTARSFEDDDERHVWWFDGTGRWLECGLDVSAPAYAVAVDPANRANVYAGTELGVYRGVFQPAANPAGDPTWAWTRLAAGLPEAPCVALTVHDGARVLRAAISGRGVFEIPIDGAPAQPAAAVFLRAHDFDLRRMAIPADARGPVPMAGERRPFGPAAYERIRLDASPDIRVRRAPGEPPPVIGTYTSAFAAGTSEPRTFEALAIQAALRRGGDAVVPVTGIDDASLRPAVERRLRREETNTAAGLNQATGLGLLGNIYPLDAAMLEEQASVAGTRTTLTSAGTPFQGLTLAGRVLRFGNTVREIANRGVSTIVTAHNDNSLTFLAVPAPVAAGDRFEILEHTPGTGAAAWTTIEQPDPDDVSTSRTHTGRTLVDVTVHTRPGPIPAGRASVVLLRARFGGLAAAPPIPALPVDWADRLRADLAEVPGNRGAWLPADWTYFDDGHVNARREVITISRAFDAQSPAVVTFEGTLPAGQWLLCAVVLDPVDAVNAAVGDMVAVSRQTRQVALRSVHAIPEPAVRRHAFFDWHESAPVLAYTPPVAPHASPDDARLVVEDENGNFKPKARLHLCFLERAVAAFELTLPGGAWRASWSIVNARGDVVADHPNYPSAAPANIVSGSYAWRWDGRKDPVAPLAPPNRGRFVTEGVYRSRLVVEPDPPVAGRRFEYTAEIRAEGKAYNVYVEGVPRNDQEMRDMIGVNDPFRRADGQRIPQDIWILAYRGQIDDGHCVFLGRGIMEATETRAAPDHGAVATPHDREYKSWFRTVNSPDRCQLEDLHLVNTNDLELIATDGVPSNPYFSPDVLLPPQPRKNFVQAHDGNRIWTEDGTTSGCTAVSPFDPVTVPAAATRLTVRGLLRSAASSFGDWDAAGVPTAPDDFANKQNKRAAPAPDTNLWARRDALLQDDHARPEVAPVAFAGADPNEPLHMQHTLQTGVFGGFTDREMPRKGVHREPALDGNDAPRVRVRCVLRDYRRGSAYHIYHHALIVKHEATLVGPNHELVLWIPRKVIRGWNGAVPEGDHAGLRPPGLADRVHHDPFPENRRNLRVTGNIQIRWFVQRTTAAGTAPYGASFVGGGPGVYAAPPNPCRNVWNWPPPPPADTGLYESVCEYQFRLQPQGADHRWHPELAVIDVLSNNRARLAAETEFRDGAGVLHFRGSSVVEIVRIL